MLLHFVHLLLASPDFLPSPFTNLSAPVVTMDACFLARVGWMWPPFRKCEDCSQFILEECSGYAPSSAAASSLSCDLGSQMNPAVRQSCVTILSPFY